MKRVSQSLKKKTFNPPSALPAEESEDKSDALLGEGLKVIVPSNNIDIWVRLEVLLGLKQTGHTDTVTEASNLIAEIYKKWWDTKRKTISKCFP